MSRTPTEPDHSPIFREINLSAEIKRLWGAKWNSPELAYRFSNDREFFLRTEDAGIYTGASVSGNLTDAIQDETGVSILDETSVELFGERAGP